MNYASDGKRLLSPGSPDGGEPAHQRPRMGSPFNPQNAPPINVQQVVENAVMSTSPMYDPNLISSIIQSVLSALQPFIAATIEASVNRAVCELNAKTWEENSYLRSEMLDLAWKVDSIQQYSRRDNVKIVGLPVPQNTEEHSDTNSTNQLVIDTCQKMGVTISDSDISTSHWIPGKKKTLIVKFACRDTKRKVMTEKKKLKKGDPMIFEDLTVARAQLLQEVQNTGGVIYAYTREGTIH